MKRLEAKAKFFFDQDTKFYVQGVTYGPFRPREEAGDHFCTPDETRRDFQLMSEAGLNVIRLYHTPPAWLLDMAQAFGLRVLVTVPWTQRTLFLQNKIRKELLQNVCRAAEVNYGHAALMGFFVDNEIPSDLVRWYGASRIGDFLDDMVMEIKSVDATLLVSYSNFPPTEYLVPQNVDFYAYNVYLHDRDIFGKYLARLHNLTEEKPLLLSEFGMDTIRHTEEEQAQLISDHYEEVFRSGLAGTILFSWTDEWFTGGVEIEDWAFGVVDRKRKPKKSYGVIQSKTMGDTESIVQTYPHQWWPRVSVVVCSYNGATTLRQCLASLSKMTYPDYEVILVDDGSKDNTQEIVKDFPTIVTVMQENQGLSVARNVGYHQATGEIIAYTDSDCMAEKDWLYHLVRPLLEGDYAAVGGPNISPPTENWVQATVAAAPGAPCHVLIDDREAEHVPGCNMAFYKWALEAIGGFDAEYRKAGDDVDVCWRIMQLGHKIGYSPSAVVWHFRRFTVKAYFNQQKGYGEAESLLRYKHTNYFDSVGGIRWRGVIYGKFRSDRLFHHPVIYHGVFGSGFFQSIYARPENYWSYLLQSFEWNMVLVAVFILSFFFESIRVVPLAMAASTLLSVMYSVNRSRLETKYDSVRARLLLSYLTWAQPLVRAWARYFTWVSKKRTPSVVSHSEEKHAHENISLWKAGQLLFWNEKSQDRFYLLEGIRMLLRDEGWKFAVDNGWTHWDFNVFANRWWHIRMRTMMEIYPEGKRLNRVALELRPTTFGMLLLGILVMVGLILLKEIFWPWSGYGLCMLGLIVLFYMLGNGLALRLRLAKLVQAAALKQGLTIV
ncbi:MAG: glycosyltransferase [Verrucomicrobiota bacterium]